jgi:hypothetical protein
MVPEDDCALSSVTPAKAGSRATSSLAALDSRFRGSDDGNCDGVNLTGTPL